MSFSLSSYLNLNNIHFRLAGEMMVEQSQTTSHNSLKLTLTSLD